MKMPGFPVVYSSDMQFRYVMWYSWSLDPQCAVAFIADSPSIHHEYLFKTRLAASGLSPLRAYAAHLGADCLCVVSITGRFNPELVDVTSSTNRRWLLNVFEAEIVKHKIGIWLTSLWRIDYDTFLMLIDHDVKVVNGYDYRGVPLIGHKLQSVRDLR